MDAIFLTENDLKKYPRLFCDCFESNIYIYNNLYVMKIYKTNNADILKNKEKKAIELNTIKTNDILPIALVYIDNVFKGYLSIYKKDYVTLINYKQSKKEKYETLQKVIEKIRYYIDEDIILGDIHQKNILINPTTSDIIFCDFDGNYVRGLDFDFRNNYLYYYTNEIKVIDERLSNFMFNIFTISYIQKVSYDYAFKSLGNVGQKLKGELNTKDNRLILQEMLNLTDTFSGDLFINHTKKRILLP